MSAPLWPGAVDHSLAGERARETDRWRARALRAEHALVRIRDEPHLVMAVVRAIADEALTPPQRDPETS